MLTKSGYAGAALWCLAWLACAAPPDGPPSILLVTLDTLRVDHVGAYSNGAAATPALDALAAEGLVHENAYTTMPITGPAHISLFTGLQPSAHGSRRNGQPLALSMVSRSLVGKLAEAGYARGAFTATSLLGYRFTGLSDFDVYDEPGGAGPGAGTPTRTTCAPAGRPWRRRSRGSGERTGGRSSCGSTCTMRTLPMAAGTTLQGTGPSTGAITAGSTRAAIRTPRPAPA